MLRAALLASLVTLAQGQKDLGESLYDISTVYICLAVVVDIILLLLCLYCLKVKDGLLPGPKYGKPKVPEGANPKDFALDELKISFETKNPGRYAGALELAREVGVNPMDIPLVFSIQKQMDTFKMPTVKKGSTISAQLCFILDYTGSMKVQISQAEQSCRKIVDAVKAMSFDHMPDAKVELEMGAVGYNDWDDSTAKLNRPVVSAFGGKDLFKRHDPSIGLEEFNLGGNFTKDTDEIMQWIKQPLGNGGSVPEELTGALLAATHLPWSAQQKLAVVITDAPCHGKAYSNESHDPFCDKETGLTCTGKPEVPLMKLKELGVQVVILHTGSAGAVKMCQKLMQTAPDLIQEKVSPSETADKMVKVLDAKLQLQPLTYLMKPFLQQGQKDVARDHTAQLTIGYENSSQAVNESGLFWVGTASSNPKVKVSRPPNSGLDKWWTNESEELEIARRFDENTSYVLKMQRIQK